MHPPFSMVFFTTLIGAAQGLMLVLVGIDLAGELGLVTPPAQAHFLIAGAGVVLLLCAVGLSAATFHLGHPLRAWRAAAMWRTSWLSREVIVLPLFMACVAGWLIAHATDHVSTGWGLACVLLALLLYLCTGMIYAAVKALREWATPLTPFNFMLLGIASGSLLGVALAALMQPQRVPALIVVALAALVLSLLSRAFSLWRNLRLAPQVSTQSAIGVRHPRITQTSQGMTAGSFGTREFFHHRGAVTVWAIRGLALLLAGVVPVAVLAFEGASLSGPLAVGVFALHYIGLLAERWSFFAEARHPQNLYHQTTART